MSEQKIYTKNYVDDECDFVLSHGDTLIDRMIDRDKDSQYITESANSDATEATIEVDFMEAGEVQERTIDTVILVNHNLKAPTIEYWTGSAWATLATGSGLTASTTIFTFAAQATERIRIRCSTTQVANAEKAIGELIACAAVLTLARDAVAYDVTFNQRKAFELTLGDGSVHRSIVMSSLNRSSKYEARVRFEFVTLAELTELQSLKDSGVAFLWQPELTQRPDEIYLVNWTSPLRHQYVSSYKGAGYVVEMELKEV